MPFLPALVTVIGIGLQCKIEPGTLISQHGGGQQVLCDKGTALLNKIQWEREMAALPPKVSRGLQNYESELKQQLVDYSKFCEMGLHVEDSNFFTVTESDIVRIFCPSEYKRCHGWKHTGRCVNKLCRRLYPMYGRISDGMAIISAECIREDGLSFRLVEGNEDTASG